MIVYNFCVKLLKTYPSSDIEDVFQGLLHGGAAFPSAPAR